MHRAALRPRFRPRPDHRPAHGGAETAHRRLLVLATAGLLLWSFACRPAFSPDGKQVVFPAKVDDQLVLARHDLEANRTDILFESNSAPAAVRFRPDAREWVVLSRAPDDNASLLVQRLSPTGEARGSHSLRVGDDALDLLLTEPAIAGGSLFVGGTSPARIDLDDFTVTAVPLDDDSEGMWMLLPRGDGVCYMHDLGEERPAKDHDWQRWELGTIDPERLQREVLLTSDAAPGWTVMPLPSFDHDLERCALPAYREPEQGPSETAILVFRGGKLETTLPIPGESVGTGPLVWGRHGATVYTVIARTNQTQLTVALYETTFSGSVQRETVLLEHTHEQDGDDVVDGVENTAGDTLVKVLPLMVQPALSPDGRLLALSTAMLDKLDASRRGLMLVDLAGGKRTVKLVPPPKKKP